MNVIPTPTVTLQNNGNLDRNTTDPSVLFPRGSQSAMGNTSKYQVLEKEIHDLQVAEQQLDDLLQMCTVQLKLLTEDPENQQYPCLSGATGAALLCSEVWELQCLFHMALF